MSGLSFESVGGFSLLHFQIPRFYFIFSTTTKNLQLKTGPYARQLTGALRRKASHLSSIKSGTCAAPHFACCMISCKPLFSLPDESTEARI
jgi:hypothetical protein